MTTKNSELFPIECMAGVQSSLDSTALNTKHYTFSDKIRFVDNVAEKIGGWISTVFQNSATILGATRNTFSITIGGKVITLMGTEQKLYALVGSRLINITPLQTTTTAIANSLATNYTTLVNNPIMTISGSMTVTVSDTSASRYVAGDLITLSGSAAVGGIPAININKQHIIRSVGTNSYTVNTGATASSSTTGGGAAVVRASGLLRVTAAAHGQANGDRVKIAGAAATGGILAVEINKEFIIRNVAAGTFDIYATTIATSSVSAAGGAATTYQKEIADGQLNASLGQGYGMGLYGVGLYGISKLSSTGVRYPRIWFCDSYGENAILTAGNGTGLYVWSGDTTIAPALVSGAPAAINYAFVSNNMVVTFGAAGIGNHIFNSDIDNYTQWVASSTNQVFEDFLENSGRLLTHVPVSGMNLLFTENSVYTFRYIGLPNIWEIRRKSSAIGIIAPMARCVVNDTAYWMGDKNFYMWNGGNVEIIPANSQKQCTIINYVFENLNYSQKSKCFAWYNKDFNEVWFHYPSQSSLECDRIARLNVSDKTWCPDTMSRSSAEYPDILLNLPRLTKYTSGASSLYRHEYGYDDDGSAMAFTLTTNIRTGGKDTSTDVGIIPDSIQSGNITLQFDGYLFPQSATTTYSKSYTITPTTERVTTLLNSRFWKYTWTGGAIGQRWAHGNWQEYIQKGATN